VYLLYEVGPNYSKLIYQLELSAYQSTFHEGRVFTTVCIYVLVDERAPKRERSSGNPPLKYEVRPESKVTRAV